LPIIYRRIRCSILAISLLWWSQRQIMESLLIGLPLCIFNWSKIWSDGRSVRKIWLKEQPIKPKKKGCMPFCHNAWSYVSKVVSIK
jgi:hypothetical protein